MSAGAKPVAERAFSAIKRLAEGRTRPRRADRRIPMAGDRTATAREAIPAHPPLDAETLRLTEKGAVFNIGSDNYLVHDRYASSQGPHADVVILHGSDRGCREDRCRVRAVQVRDVERLIRAGCIASRSVTDAAVDHSSADGDDDGQATSTSIGADGHG